MESTDGTFQKLRELAQNLWWSWQPDAVELFRRLDRRLWEEVYHNPVKLLGVIDQSKLAAAASFNWGMVPSSLTGL